MTILDQVYNKEKRRRQKAKSPVNQPEIDTSATITRLKQTINDLMTEPIVETYIDSPRDSEKLVVLRQRVKKASDVCFS